MESAVVQLIRNRYLLYHLVRRDVASRFIGSFAGIFWSVVHPLILLVVYSTVFVFILQVKLGPGARQNFAEFLFCGLWAWIAFQDAMLAGVNTVVGSPNLVKRMMFPLEILVPAAVLATLFLQLIGFGLFFIYLLVFGKIPLTGVVRLVWFLFPLMLQILFSLGMGWLVSALQVFVRDTAQAVAALITVWFFLTPIFYPLDLVPAAFRTVLNLNPWTHLVEMYRHVVFDGRLDWSWGTLYVVLVAVILFWGGHFVFQKLRPEFADAL